MGRPTWIAGLVLCAGLTDRQAAAGQPLIHVMLINQAEVPPDTLQRARNVATHVFQLSGITLVWVAARTCQARCLTVHIVTQPISAKSRDPQMLGVAPNAPEVQGTISGFSILGSGNTARGFGCTRHSCWAM